MNTCHDEDPETVTIEWIQSMLARIASEDPENAHVLEDCLHARVLRVVALHGPPDLAMLAAEALKTQDMNFPRWYA